MAWDLRTNQQPFDGRWWLVDDESTVVPGRLFLDGGFWRLKLFGSLGPDPPSDDTPTLHGQVGSKRVTLLDTVYLGSASSGNEEPYETRLAVNTVLVGAHVRESTEYVTASVRFHHLDQWSDRSPWSFDHSDDSEGKRETFTFTEPDTLEASLPGATARLRRGLAQSSGDSRIELTSREAVEFDFDQPKHLDEVRHEWVRPMQALLELAAAASSPVTDLTLIALDGAAESDVQIVSVLSEEPRDSLSKPKIPYFFLFTLREVDFAEVLVSWWTLQAEIGIIAAAR